MLHSHCSIQLYQHIFEVSLHDLVLIAPLIAPHRKKAKRDFGLLPQAEKRTETGEAH